MSQPIEKNMVYVTDDNEICIFEKNNIPKGLRNEFEGGFYSVGTRPGMMGLRPCLEIEEEPIYPESTKHLSNAYFNDNYIKNYFSDDVREFHKTLSIKHKLGILLHGIPGTGKTSAAYHYCKSLIKDFNAMVITVNDKDDYSFVDNFLTKYRKISNQMVVILFDECEYYLDQYENYFKRKLDSNESIENVLTIFITNKYDYIPTNISERPSRIKFSKQIDGITDKSLIELILNDFTEPLNNSKFKETNNYLDLAIDHILEKKSKPTIDEVKNYYLDFMLDVMCDK